MTVNARTVPSGSSQAYALVMRGPEADETPTAPAFGANPGTVSALSGLLTNFTVTASGYPIPVLALESTTATGGSYLFEPESGYCIYEPPAADIGSNTFSFTATNTEGTVTQVVSVVVGEGPPEAPASVWASETNALDFTAAWSSATGADSYRLDVATNATFSGGGGGGGTPISENIQSWTAHASYGSWTQAIAAGDATMTQCIVQPTASASGMGSIGRVQMKATDGILALPALDTVGTVTLNIAAGGASRTAKLQRYVAGTWTDLTTWSGIGTTGATFTWDLNSGDAGIQLRIAFASSAIYVHDIIVTSYGSSSSAYLPGYSNRTVSGTSQSVTGLVAETEYFFRARAVNAAGASGNSPTGSVTTTAVVPGTPPAMVAIPDQVTGVGADFEYTVTATEGDGDSFTFACTSAVDEATWAVDTNGYFLFIPSATEVGTNIFVFTATDKDGTSAPAQMSIRVNTQAATNAFEEWVQDQGEDPGSTNFTESADFDGDGATTEEEYVADTDPVSSNSVLVLTGSYVIATGGGTGDIILQFPASTGRYYQLEYCTGLTNYLVGTSNLGWGVLGMAVTNNSTGTWYGVIRAFLQEP